jgi:hypothetical protein
MTVKLMTLSRRYACLAEAEKSIRDGDLLQFRPRRWRLGEQLTAIAGRGEHCHSALAAWWSGRAEVRGQRAERNDVSDTSALCPLPSDLPATLMCLESRRVGIRAVTLRSQVLRFPGLIDVYETNQENVFPGFSRAAMVAAMREKTGRAYGLRLLLRTALSHTLLVRLIVRARVNDNGHDTDHLGPEFCSQAIASAARLAGGEDPVAALSDRSTEPADLVRCQLFNRNGEAYRFTHIP